MDTIGFRIRMVREKEGLSQNDFADRLFVLRPHFSRIESGKENPADSLVKLIALEFRVSYTWLKAGIGSMDADEEKHLNGSEELNPVKDKDACEFLLEARDYLRVVILGSERKLQKNRKLLRTVEHMLKTQFDWDGSESSVLKYNDSVKKEAAGRPYTSEEGHLCGKKNSVEEIQDAKAGV